MGRKAIHCDINPLANFICQQIAVSPLDIDAFRAAFDEIEYHCKEAINEVYSMADEEVEDLEIRYWYPEGIKLPKNADAKYIEELFTKRQLFSLSLLLHRINQLADSTIKNLMKFTFSATLNKTNLTFSSTHGRSAGRGNSGIIAVCSSIEYIRSRAVVTHDWVHPSYVMSRNTQEFSLESFYDAERHHLMI